MPLGESLLFSTQEFLGEVGKRTTSSSRGVRKLKCAYVCIIDLSAVHAVVGVVIGIGKGIHGLTPSRNRARGQFSQDGRSLVTTV
jgi:hypothetical protein